MFYTLREVVPDMEREDWGRVVAISSIAGLKGLKGAGAYSTSKHGVIGLIRSFSEDFMGSGLTFNAICPAYVDTAIVTRNVDAISKDRRRPRGGAGHDARSQPPQAPDPTRRGRGGRHVAGRRGIGKRERPDHRDRRRSDVAVRAAATVR